MPHRYLRIWIDQHNPNSARTPQAYLVRGQTEKGVTHTLAEVKRHPIDPRGGDELRLHADLIAATLRRSLVRRPLPPGLAPRNLERRKLQNPS